MADNLISARLVLANATTVTVSSVENTDLFWALRGAGHNFGIVTEFEYRIHDRKPEDEALAYELMMFKEQQLEEVYEVANGMVGGDVSLQPVGLAHWTMIMRNSEFDPVNVSLRNHRASGMPASLTILMFVYDYSQSLYFIYSTRVHPRFRQITVNRCGTSTQSSVSPTLPQCRASRRSRE